MGYRKAPPRRWVDWAHGRGALCDSKQDHCGRGRGYPQNDAVVREVGVPSPTAITWRRGFAADGAECLTRDRPCRGREGLPVAEVVVVKAVVGDTLHAGPKGATQWSARLVARKHGIGATAVQGIQSVRQLKPHPVRWVEVGQNSARIRITFMVRGGTHMPKRLMDSQIITSKVDRRSFVAGAIGVAAAAFVSCRESATSPTSPLRCDADVTSSDADVTRAADPASDRDVTTIGDPITVTDRDLGASADPIGGGRFFDLDLTTVGDPVADRDVSTVADPTRVADPCR